MKRLTVGILSYARGTIVISEILIDFALGKEYQFGCGILKMVVDPKKQDFWSKINMLKGNHCILRIRVHQKVPQLCFRSQFSILKIEGLFYLRITI